MSCNCLASKDLSKLKKPNKPPPPPPKMRLNRYLDQMRHSTNTTQDSDCCSEGVQSVSSFAMTTQSCQPSMFCKYDYTASESDYFSTRSECFVPSCHCLSRVSRCCSNAPVSYCGMSSPRPAVEAPPPPVHQAIHNNKKLPRPKLSISPMPVLKRAGRQTGARTKCESLSYKRHIEQHIERIFKYLKDRQKRLDECESAIQANIQPQDVKIIRDLLVNKETRYLRSLRARLGPKHFKEIKKLGAGYIGNVWLVEKVDSIKNEGEKPELYAMKKLKKSQVFRENHMAHIMAERDILAEADNEWIVKLYYSFQDDLYLYFILEYIPGGDLMNLLYDRNVFPEHWARFYIAEISLALQFVHDMKFIHRDVKPDNILIDRNGHIKLTDFGLCTGFRWTHDKNFYIEDPTTAANATTSINQDDHPTITKALTRREFEYSMRAKKISVVGSPNYIAPEVLDQQRQTGTNERLCDWWSVGVILYEMVIGYCPFIDWPKIRTNEYDVEKDSPEQIQMRIVNWRDHLAFPSPNDPNSPPLKWENGGEPYYISEDTKSLIKGWICDPHERLCQNGIKDIQDHPFFKTIDWQRIRYMPAPFKPVLEHERDTRHFDQFAHSPENEATLGGSNLTHKMAMNDFTFRCFWKKPMN